MNMIIESILALLDWVIRQQETAGRDPQEVEQYIQLRNALREQLVQEAVNRGSDQDEEVPDSTGEPPTFVDGPDLDADSEFADSIDESEEAGPMSGSGG